MSRIRAGIAAVRDSRSQGGQVLVIRADVSNEVEMRAALSETQRRFGTLHGIIHTAGELGQGLIYNKTADEVDRVFAPKALGILVLERLLRERSIEPDLLILCSSAASVAPIAGQVDYCAANAFLDSYATSRIGSGRTTVISIDWGFWQELGMITQARSPDASKQQIVDEIRAKGRSDAGVEAFRHILDKCPPPQVLVWPDGIDRLIPGAAGAAVVSQAPQQQQQRPRHPWFDACPVDTADIKIHVSHLGIRDWVLNEHRPLGKAVLPGTAFLELARAAFEAYAGPGPVQMNDVYFLVPLVVEDHETKEIQTILTRRGAGFDFVVVSRVRAHADEWLEHARGEIAALTLAAPPPRDLAEIETLCRQDDITVAKHADSNDRHKLADRFHNFTPHWRNLERLRLGPRQGLATLELAPAFAAEFWRAAAAPRTDRRGDRFHVGRRWCRERIAVPLRTRADVEAVGIAGAQPCAGRRELRGRTSATMTPP